MLRRRLATIMFAVAAIGMSGCCGDEAVVGWASFLLGEQCGESVAVDIELVPPTGAVVAGVPVQLELREKPIHLGPRDYYWDLDGDRRTDKRVSVGPTKFAAPLVHTFPRAGRVRVNVELFVEVIGSVGAGRGLASLEIDVQPSSPASGNRPPIAAFELPESVAAGDGFVLDARVAHDPDGEIVQYGWDLEGGPEREIESASPIAEHAYDTTGEKTITLTVVDDRGEAAQAQKTILVTGGDRAQTAAAARRRPGAEVRRFSARLSGLFPARTPRPTARGLTLSGLRGSGRLRAKLDSPVRPLGRLAKARWRGRLRFTFQARTGIARLRGRVIARARGPRPPRVCLRLAVTAPPFGRPATGRLTVLGGTRAAAFLRGSARFTVARVSGSAVRMNGRLKVRKRTRPRGLEACSR